MNNQQSIISLILLLASTLLVLLPVLFVILFTILYYRRQSLYFGQLNAFKAASEKEILQARLEIQEKTFENISQEIHDNIGQEISIAKLYLNTYSRDDLLDSERKVREASEMLTKVMHDIRHISKDLNGNMIQRVGLVEVIRHNLAYLERSGKFQVTLEVTGDAIFMEEKKEIVIFRIFQEAVNNMIKHAQASRVDILLQYEATRLTMTVKDNGTGFGNIDSNPQAMHSSGIINMKQRTAMMGGELTISSEPGKGTLIKVSIPYANDNYRTGG